MCSLWLLVLVAIVATSASLDDDAGVISLIEQQVEPEALREAAVEYDSIPGLRFEPKSSVHFPDTTMTACRQLCNKRKTACKAFSYNQAAQECKISEEHLGYDPDFVMEQKGQKNGEWDFLPGLTGYTRGYLRVEGQSQRKCKALCAKAPACALISYRQRDGLCLVSGRALELDDNWTYYEKEGVARNSKGFVLSPVGSDDGENKWTSDEAEHLRLMKEMADAQEALDHGKQQLAEAQHAKDVEKHKLADAKTMVRKLDAEIAEVKVHEKQQAHMLASQASTKLEAQSLEEQKQTSMTLQAQRLEHSEAQRDSQIKAAQFKANAEVGAAQQKAQAMAESAQLMQQIRKYKQQIQEAHEKSKDYSSREEKWDISEEQVQERASKKIQIAAAERQHKEHTFQKNMAMKLQHMHQKIRRIASEAEIDANTEDHKIRMLRAAKLAQIKANAQVHLRSAAVAYNTTMEIERSNAASHEQRVKLWHARERNATQVVAELDQALTDAKTQANATQLGIKMKLNAIVSDTPGELKNAEALVTSQQELENLREQHSARMREEMLRFKERQAARDAEAEREARQEYVTNTLQKREADAKLTVQAARETLEKAAIDASKLPDHEAHAMMHEANQKYENTVTKQNAILVQPLQPIRDSKTHEASEQVQLSFEATPPQHL